jgi:hypothetical protein
VELGREEGRQAGLQAGYKDGLSLGRTKGIEFGMELGFIRGFLNTVEHTQWESSLIKGQEFEEQQQQQQRAVVAQRIQKGLQDLRQAIEDFPSPDAIFASSTMNNDNHNNENDSEEEAAAQATANATDVMGALQRIRAKFKVLTVQLKIPHYSLHQVMSDAAVHVVDDEEKERTGVASRDASGSEGKVLDELSQGESYEW